MYIKYIFHVSCLHPSCFFLDQGFLTFSEHQNDPEDPTSRVSDSQVWGKAQVFAFLAALPGDADVAGVRTTFENHRPRLSNPVPLFPRIFFF